MVANPSLCLRGMGAEKREYCGAFGIYSFSGKDVAHDIYLGLMYLQHRGQDSAGAAVYGKKGLLLARGLGHVPDVLTPSAIEGLTGHVGIGHVRYPTIGAGGAEDAQPFMAEAGGRKLALAHNGNISNYGRVRKAMEGDGTAFASTCDAELILASYARHYAKTKDHFEAAAGMMGSMDGAYSVVLITDAGELVAFRDPQAIRPLCFGQDSERMVFSSESVALDIIRCPHSGDLAPGEVVVVSPEGIKRKVVCAGKKPRHCMFEYVYFSRPDSKLDGRWVYEVRHRLGRALAKASPVKADVVVAVPDTARSAVEGYSEQSGIPVAEGLIKNRYIGRTFIMPSQKKRQEAVRLKLNAVRHVVEGKRVVLIDDSIVRGTTMGPIVKLVRDGGAKEIHLRITCPPIISPCFYGIDMPSFTELVAANKSVEEIRKAIGADSLVYQAMDGLVSAIGMKKEELCTGCITGEYPTEFGALIAKRMKEAKSSGAIRAWEEKE